MNVFVCVRVPLFLTHFVLVLEQLKWIGTKIIGISSKKDDKIFHPRLEGIQVSMVHQRKRALPRLMRQESSKESGCGNTYRGHFKQYLLNTTLHGLKYVGDNTITFFERIFFGLMTFVVFFVSVYFISNVWNKFLASPMIISLNPKLTDIRNLPFPAVTICNMNQALNSVVRTIPNDHEDYSMIRSLCTHAVDQNITKFKAGKWADYRTLLLKVSQPCSEMLLACMYGAFKFKCTDIFVPVLTDDGLCCSFNLVNKKFLSKSYFDVNTEFLDATANDWTPEKGFASEELKLNKSGYPRPVAGTGTNLGLTVVLDAGISEYYCSSTVSYGFKVLLHNPHEDIKIATYGNLILSGYESRIAVQPTLSEATDAIRKLPIDIRQCYFEDENFLTFYRTYSRSNCNVECNAKIMLSHCNCVLYYMPRFEDNITICGRADEACVDEVTSQIQMQKKHIQIQCGCLPGCFDIHYDAEISIAPLFQQAYFFSKQGLRAPNVSVVHVYYKSMFFRSQKKEGLLGLFMGFSVFSIIEVFYFLTIRPYITHVSQRRRLQRIARNCKNFRSRRTALAQMAKHVNHMEVNDDNTVYYPYVG